MKAVKSGTWLDDLIEVYNDLGGIAPYDQVYERAQQRRVARGATWTAHAKDSLRRTVEDHARSSANFRGRPVFYSVHGHGEGVWRLMPDYLREALNEGEGQQLAYLEGAEGIVREIRYLTRSRDPRLVEQRKIIDDYTCQVCKFRLMIEGSKFIIDVHHLNPVGSMVGVVITSIKDLVCLCPTCHRIAHVRQDRPLSLREIGILRKTL